MGNRVIGTEYFENCENCKNDMIKYDAISASYFRVLMKEDFTRTWGVSSYGPLQAPMRVRLLPRQYSIDLTVTYYIPAKREDTLGSLRYLKNILKNHNCHKKMEIRKLDRMLIRMRRRLQRKSTSLPLQIFSRVGGGNRRPRKVSKRNKARHTSRIVQQPSLPSCLAHVRVGFLFTNMRQWISASVRLFRYAQSEINLI